MMMAHKAASQRQKEFEEEEILSRIEIPPSMDMDSTIDFDEDLESDTIDSIMESLEPFTSRTKGDSTGQDALNSYVNTISYIPRLSSEEINTLLKKVKEEDDKNAVFLVIVNHLRLVIWIAMTFQRKWNQNLQDLIQEGNLGLLRALEKFELDKGVKFSYYATFWIKAYILKYLMANWRLVKIGTTQTQRKLFYTLNREQQKLMAMGFTANSAILAQHFNVSEEHIIEMQQRLEGSDISVDVDPSQDSSHTVVHLSSKDSTEGELVHKDMCKKLHQQLETIFPTLNCNEQCILQERILAEQPVTLQTLGERLHISRERVRQIEARLIQKIRAHFTDNLETFSEEWLAF